MPKRTDISSIVIIGSACEFDCSGPQDSLYLFERFEGKMK